MDFLSGSAGKESTCNAADTGVRVPSLGCDEQLSTHIENPKVCTQKLLELTSEFSKVAGYKVDIQKFVALHPNFYSFSFSHSFLVFPFHLQEGFT